MRKITLVSVDCGSGHACELARGLKKYGRLTVVWQNRNLHGLDVLYRKHYKAQYGFNKIPHIGDDLVIVACVTWDRLKEHWKGRFRTILNNYQRVHIIVTDGRYARNPRYYNKEFDGVDVITNGCKRHFREPLPVKTFYQPFDLSHIDQTKNGILTVGHSPFVQKKFREKGTNIITRAVRDRGVNFDLITGVSWSECLKRKAKCHIFVDQVDHYALKKFKFKTPDYVWPALGKSGIEAMHLGCLVITYGKSYNTDIPAPPVMWVNKENFKETLDFFISHPNERNELAILQKEWALRYATSEFAAQQVLK